MSPPYPTGHATPWATRSGITLVEMLVAVGILILLLALLLPSFSSSRESARAAKCASNLHQLHTAAEQRRLDEAMRSGHGATIVRPSNWVGALLPAVQGEADVFLCPSDQHDAGASGQDGPPEQESVKVEVLEQPPGSVDTGAMEDDERIILFREREKITLSQDLDVDAVGPGEISTASAGGTIPKGTKVDSWLMHYDPTGEDRRDIQTNLNFSGKILGVILKTASLKRTDDVLGAPGTEYPGHWARGFENPGEDSATMQSDRLSMNVWFSTSGATEQVRVVAEPGDAAYSSYGMNVEIDGRLGGSRVMLAGYGKLVIDLDESEDGIVDDPRHRRLRHDGEANVLFGDGSVQRIGDADFFDPDADHW